MDANDLSRIQRQAEQAAREVVEIHEKFHLAFGNAWRRLKDGVSSYQTGRNQLFILEASRRRLTWCTKCEKMVPLEDCKLFIGQGSFVQRGKEYAGGRKVYFKKISRLCYDCREAMLEDIRPSSSHFFAVEMKDGSFFDREGNEVEGIENLEAIT